MGTFSSPSFTPQFGRSYKSYSKLYQKSEIMAAGERGEVHVETAISRLEMAFIREG